MTKIMKKNKKNHRKKIRLVAAAVLSVTLLSAQMTPAAVKNTETVSQQNNVIPENIVVNTTSCPARSPSAPMFCAIT